MSIRDESEKAASDAIVDKVRALRKEHRRTVAELAEHLGIPANTANGMFVGRKRAAFTVGEVIDIAEFFDVPVSAIDARLRGAQDRDAARTAWRVLMDRVAEVKP